MFVPHSIAGGLTGYALCAWLVLAGAQLCAPVLYLHQAMLQGGQEQERSMMCCNLHARVCFSLVHVLSIALITA